MNEIRDFWTQELCIALEKLLGERGIDEQIPPLAAEVPPDTEMGDIGFPMFPMAKIFKASPAQIAQDIAGILSGKEDLAAHGTVKAVGPYVNMFFDRAKFGESVIKRISDRKERYGANTSLDGQKVMIEFSCPNTNKPLHLGHLRNDAIGFSVSNLLAFCGADVRRVNLINDRGMHICKSMLAYKEYGGNDTPESTGIKGDHFVGDYYVKYARWVEEDPSIEQRVQKMLQDWEAGDPETVALWKKMNGWVMDGVMQTYEKTGITFDKLYYESDTYTSGRGEVLRGLEEGIFFQNDDGSIWVDLTDDDLDQKLLLRKDGTSVYMTQDIGTVMARMRDWPFDRLIYVVASEQNYHFNVLFLILKKLGFEAADSLHHLSYGMVNLPDGKLKSREGTAADADDLISLLTDLAAAEIVEKERDQAVDDVRKTAERIALSAINYFLLKVAAHKDMIFDPNESISFNGDTGPYLQYMGARISSMLEKFEERGDEFADGSVNTELISSGDEWLLFRFLSEFPEVVLKAATDLNPSLVTSYLYELSKIFSRYYHDNPVLHNDNHDVVQLRIALSRAILQVLKNGFALIGIPFLEKM